MRENLSCHPARQVPTIPRSDFFQMKPLCSLANDGFHEAAGCSQLPDDAWVPGIGHVRPQRGLQVNPGEGEFGLQGGTDIAF